MRRPPSPFKQYNGVEVTAYFNALMDTVAHATDLDDASFVKVVEAAERDMMDDVVLIAEDEEFPSKLKSKMIQASQDLGVWKTDNDVDTDDEKQQVRTERVLMHRTSLLIGVLHNLFHILDRKKIKTRFGMLTDDPHDMLSRRKDYNENRTHLYGDNDWTLEELEWVTGQTHPVPRVVQLASMLDDIVKDKNAVPPDSQINARLAALIFSAGLRKGASVADEMMQEKLKKSGIDLQFIDGLGVTLSLPRNSIDINPGNIDEVRRIVERMLNGPPEVSNEEGSEATDDEN